MGINLTGLTPATTYDALIKVGDNGPLDGTLKALSDGLGNDSALALSTGAASVTGTLNVSGLTIFNTASADNQTVQVFGNNSSVVIGADKGGGASIKYNTNGNLDITPRSTFSTVFTAGNVGIGTSAPSGAKLVVEQAAAGNVASQIINSTTAASGVTGYGLIVESEASAVTSYNAIFRDLAQSQNYLVIKTETGQVGHVGINTFNPAVHLDVNGQIRANSGILFGTDTAAANALDDYEEGTWTMGVSFGGASVGLTTSINTGTYTKIGRQVTVNGRMDLTSKGISVGDANITGLPFTIPNNFANNATASLLLISVSFANQFQGFGVENSTFISLFETTEAGALTSLTDADFANNSAIIVSLTYFV